MKKLYRSRRTKLLGGVAAGFAEYFGTDTTIVRLLFALIAVTVPSSILAYILAWIIIPEASVGAGPAPQETFAQAAGDGATQAGPAGSVPPTADEILGGESAPAPVPAGAQAAPRPAEPERNRQLFGYILIAVGVVVLAKRFIPSFIWRFPGRFIGQAWPVVIILVGMALIFGAIRGR